MIIVVKHSIAQPDKFWASAQESLPKLPEAGVSRVLQVLPNQDSTEATCIWEADSIETLDNYLRSKVFDWSAEKYQEVNVAQSMGLSV